MFKTKYFYGDSFDLELQDFLNENAGVTIISISHSHSSYNDEYFREQTTYSALLVYKEV